MKRLHANGLLVLTAFIWGTTFVVQQVGTGGLQAISFTGSRMLAGGFFVLPFALHQYFALKKSGTSISSADWYGIAATGLVLLSAGALQQFGIFHTTVTNAGFLTALYVPLVPVISFFVLRRTIHWVVWPAALCCVGGTYIMSGTTGLSLQFGDSWVVGSSFFWAIHVILVGTMAGRTGAPLVVACGQFMVCGVGGLVLGAIVEHPGAADFRSAWFGILYAGLFSTGIAFTLQVIGQRYTHEADAAIILSLETVFAAMAGFIILGERLSAVRIAGAVIILAAVLAVQLVPYAQRRSRILHDAKRSRLSDN
jgi:drug/metabolite transporter (DMT)-like permease